jgi:hypothetical protein
MLASLTTRPIFVRTRACNDNKKKNKRKKKLSEAIKHATMICLNFEDTRECRVAWDQVEELSAAENDLRNRAKELTKMLDDESDEWWEFLSERDYDV